jgi:Sulfolobus virus coat protein C terminal.
MPLYRDGISMFEKYQKKYNPTVIGTRFGDVQDVALARAQSGLNKVDAIRAMVRDYLDAKGITGGLRAVYLAFALKLWKHVERQGGAASDKIANGLIAYFSTAFDLDTALLTDIANAIIVKPAATP